MKSRTLPTIVIILSILLTLPAAAAEIAAIRSEISESESRLIIELIDGASPCPRFVTDEDCWHIDFLKTQTQVQLPSQVFEQGPLRLVRLSQVCDAPPIQRLICHIQPGTQMKMRYSGSTCTLFFRREDEARPRFPGPPDADSAGLISPEMTRNEILIDVRKTQTAPLFLELANRAGVEIQFRDRPGAAAVKLHGKDPLTLMKDLARQLNMVMTLEDGTWWLSRKSNPLLTIPTTGRISAASLAGLTVSEALNRLVGPDAGRRIVDRLPRRIRERPLTTDAGTAACPRRWVEQILEAHGVETRS